MSLKHKLSSLFRNLFMRSDKDKDVDEELESYVGLLAEEKIQAGLDPRTAAREARVELGGKESVKEKIRQFRLGHSFDTLVQDIRYGVRMLRKNPGFTVVAVLTLALGIGANTAIFSVVNAVLLRPLPFSDPDRIVSVWAAYDGPYYMTAQESFDFRERQKSFEYFGLFYDGRSAATLTGAGDPLQISVHNVTPELFFALGVEPILGRTFTEEEDLPGQDTVAVLEHGFWSRQFGGDTSIVGKTISLDDQKIIVVGVMPPGFALPFHNFPTDIWVPMGLDWATWGNRTSFTKFVPVARLKPGVTYEQAADDMRRISSELIAEYPEAYPEEFARFRLRGVASIHHSTTQNIRPALLILLGGVGLVLLIACANVAGLLLSRAASRGREIAIRSAVGAGRNRIVRQLLTESLLLFLVGGLAGVLLAYWSLSALIRFAPQEIPRLQETNLDFRVLSFALGVSGLTGIFFGLIPAWHTTKGNWQSSLKEGGRATGAAGRSRLRSLLVMAELALSLILLMGSGLLMQSFYNLLQVDLGFATDNALSFRIRPPRSRYREPQQVNAFYSGLLRRVRTLPGVEAAGAISFSPLKGFGRTNTSTMVEGMAPNRPEYPIQHGIFRALWRNVTPGYFRAMGISILQGRSFRESDSEKAPAVMIVDETFAREAWPNEENILGKRVAFPVNYKGGVQQWRTVVGVASNAQNLRLPENEVPQCYFMQSQVGGRAMDVIVKTTNDPKALLPMLREEVAALDPALPMFEVMTLNESLSGVVAEPRFNAILMGWFAFLALAMGSVGLFGVISYSITQRTHEIALRMALGAQQRNIFRMVLGQGIGMTLMGLSIGLIGAFALTRYLESMLLGVTATDPATFAGVAVLLLVVALLATYIPARRATKVDPMVALRYE